MIGKYVLPFFAVIGLALAIGTVIYGNQTPPIVPPVVQSAKLPFASYVAGAGLVQASTENIAIGTPVSGIVMAIYVKWGDRVNTGEPLFKVDDRDLQGQLLVAIAKTKEAEANLAKTKYLLKVAEGETVGRSISAVDLATAALTWRSKRQQSHQRQPKSSSSKSRSNAARSGLQCQAVSCRWRRI